MFKSSSLLLASALVLTLASGCDKLANAPSLTDASSSSGMSATVPTEMPTTETAPVQKDIVDTAVGAGSFTVLASLLTEAGLIDTLKGPGPFTVFAPNDAAFAKIPAADLNALKADQAKLRKVLLYHVLSSKVTAAEVPENADVATAATDTVKVMKANGSVMVNDSKVISADIMASNGVIHVIDTVLMPKM
jgi:uncharacterized surface protein with fasciclin (FAS1) repeats